MRTQIAVLGSTGRIGQKTLQVAKHLDVDVVAMAAHSNIDLLEQQAHLFSPRLIAVFDKEAASELQKRLPHIPVLSGMEGLKEVARFEPAHMTMIAMAGSVGIEPTLAAIQAKKRVGLANKEALVAAGEMIVAEAYANGVDLIPVDSEHSALFQCLRHEKKAAVERLILTASGGPFFGLSDFSQVTVREALKHPNFSMGPKTSINSSTLMNKGFEMIEAKWLYGLEPNRIQAVIHPEQRVQSCVEFVDGSILAQISEPDMTIPIQYAITYPERKRGTARVFDFVKNGKLTFFEPDKKKFRCLQLAIDAMHAGMSYPCFLNAANEVIVERFLRENIGWNDIFEKLAKLISSHDPENLVTLEAILEVDRKAREKASRV